MHGKQIVIKPIVGQSLLVATFVLASCVAYITGQVVGEQRVYQQRFIYEQRLVESELLESLGTAEIVKDSKGKAVIVADGVDRESYDILRVRLTERFGSVQADHALSGITLAQ